MPVTALPDRAILSVTGVDARGFLNNLVTCNVEGLHAGDAAFGALLTPQGKILFDFFVVSKANDEFWLDAPAEIAPALAKRLAMYKLRAKVAIALTERHVVAVWGDDDTAPSGFSFRDPRADRLGHRIIVEEPPSASDQKAYEAHRIALGIPKGGIDFPWGDAFPHEANMDLLHGVSFTKGCYVGQEVVSRMQHRGTTRRRIVRATFAGNAPVAGSDIRAGDMLLGTFGSSQDGQGIAAVRLDRLKDAERAGLPPLAGDTTLVLMPPT